MAKPIIGISGNINFTNTGEVMGAERAYVNCDYVNSVIAGGGAPIILPVITDAAAIEAQIKGIDGLLISGGYDVNPLLYGEEPRREQEFIYPEIDEYYIKIIETAYKLGKPILGICKGEQIINVAFGGTLYQDMTQINDSYIMHTQKSKRNMAGHTIDILENTKLHSILGDKSTVNSFHHQAVKAVAPGFRANAYSKDGVVEGIEHEGENFVLGVQWHPEGMIEKYPEMIKLFKALGDHSKNKVDNE